MKCLKCGKETSRENNRVTLIGMYAKVKMNLDPTLPDDIDYYNQQLGKYSNGQGECEVCLCYECYLDGMFNI